MCLLNCLPACAILALARGLISLSLFFFWKLTLSISNPALWKNRAKAFALSASLCGSVTRLRAVCSRPTSPSKVDLSRYGAAEQQNKEQTPERSVCFCSQVSTIPLAEARASQLKEPVVIARTSRAQQRVPVTPA